MGCFKSDSANIIWSGCTISQFFFASRFSLLSAVPPVAKFFGCKCVPSHSCRVFCSGLYFHHMEIAKCDFCFLTLTHIQVIFFCFTSLPPPLSLSLLPQLVCCCYLVIASSAYLPPSTLFLHDKKSEYNSCLYLFSLLRNMYMSLRVNTSVLL